MTHSERLNDEENFDLARPVPVGTVEMPRKSFDFEPTFYVYELTGHISFGHNSGSTDSKCVIADSRLDRYQLVDVTDPVNSNTTSVT